LECNPGIYLTCKCRDLGEADSSPAGRGDTIYRYTGAGPGPGVPGARPLSRDTWCAPRAPVRFLWPSALPAAMLVARSVAHGLMGIVMPLVAPCTFPNSNRTVAGASPSHRRRHTFCSSFSSRFRGQVFRKKKTFRVFLRFALQGKHTCSRHRKIHKRSRSKTTIRSLAPFGEAICGIRIGYIAAFLCFDSVLSFFAVVCEENILRSTYYLYPM